MPIEVSGKKYSECKEWPGNFVEYHHFRDIRKMVERLPENFCRHKEKDTWLCRVSVRLSNTKSKASFHFDIAFAALILAVYARLNFAAGKVRNTSKSASR